MNTTQMTYAELQTIVTERAPNKDDICYLTQDEWDAVVCIAGVRRARAKWFGRFLRVKP